MTTRLIERFGKKQVFVSKTFANLRILMLLHSNMILGIQFNFGGTFL